MRLLTPWSNPEQHEHPFDLLFATPEAARVAREEYEADDEPWVLVRVTYQVSAAAGTLEGAWLHERPASRSARSATCRCARAASATSWPERCS